MLLSTGPTIKVLIRLKLLYKTKNHVSPISRRRHSHYRRVENASFFEPELICGPKLNVG